MKDNTPIFELDLHSPDKIKEAELFHERIIEFIELNISGKEDTELLCYMHDEETGELLEAKLPRSAYKHSLKKSLQFFTELENYEKCKELQDIIAKIK